MASKIRSNQQRQSQPQSAPYMDIQEADRELDQESAENQSLKLIVESLKAQLQEYTTTDQSSHQQLLGLKAMNDKNFHLQQKLESHQKKNRELETQAQELIGRLEEMQSSPARQHLESKQISQHNRDSTLSSEMRQLKSEIERFSRAAADLDDKLLREQQRGMELQSELDGLRRSNGGTRKSTGRRA